MSTVPDALAVVLTGGGARASYQVGVLRSVARHLPGTKFDIITGVSAGAMYVLVEQIEACFQLMEIRAALGMHFVGFNAGRWDYINSVSDALSWNPAFINPNIDAIVMTYGYMRNYEDRVRRGVNTPDLNGRFALWQGGMETNIPVGLPAPARRRTVRSAGSVARRSRCC